MFNPTAQRTHITVSLENLTTKIPGRDLENVRRTMKNAARYIRELEARIKELEANKPKPTDDEDLDGYVDTGRSLQKVIETSTPGITGIRRVTFR